MREISKEGVLTSGPERTAGSERVGRTSRSLLLLLLAAWTGFRSATLQRQAALDRARLTVGRVAERITAEMSSEIQVAQTLALSSSLASGDLASFYEEAQRLRDVRPLWYTIELDDFRGDQLLNLLRPFGASLNSNADRTSRAKHDQKQRRPQREPRASGLIGSAAIRP